MRKGRIEQWEKDIIKDMRDNNKSYGKVAKQLNCSIDRIKDYCQANGLGGHRTYLNKEQREKKFKKQFELLNPNFKYHSEYKSVDDYFKSECKVCGHLEERHGQATRPSKAHKEIQCSNCNELKKLRKELIDILNRFTKYELKKEERIELEKQRQKDLVTVCVECGKTFNATSLGMKYCSLRCSRRMSNRGRDKRTWDTYKANGKIDRDITLSKLIKIDKGVCHICNGKCDRQDYIKTEGGHFAVGTNYPSIDHIIPKSKGGTHTWDNIKLAHHYCNSIKSDKEVYEEGTGQLKMIG